MTEEETAAREAEEMLKDSRKYHGQAWAWTWMKMPPERRAEWRRYFDALLASPLTAPQPDDYDDVMGAVNRRRRTLLRGMENMPWKVNAGPGPKTWAELTGTG